MTDVSPLYAYRQFVTDKADFGFDADGARVGDTPNIAMDAGSENLARIIAAAPDMLAALRDARFTLSQICEGQHPDNVCCHHLRAVEAAIAKAEGRK